MAELAAAAGLPPEAPLVEVVTGGPCASSSPNPPAAPASFAAYLHVRAVVAAIRMALGGGPEACSHASMLHSSLSCTHIIILLLP